MDAGMVSQPRRVSGTEQPQGKGEITFKKRRGENTRLRKRKSWAQIIARTRDYYRGGKINSFRVFFSERRSGYKRSEENKFRKRRYGSVLGAEKDSFHLLSRGKGWPGVEF